MHRTCGDALCLLSSALCISELGRLWSLKWDTDPRALKFLHTLALMHWRCPSLQAQLPPTSHASWYLAASPKRHPEKMVFHVKLCKIQKASRTTHWEKCRETRKQRQTSLILTFKNLEYFQRKGGVFIM